jgi:hypothetical protein
MEEVIIKNLIKEYKKQAKDTLTRDEAKKWVPEFIYFFLFVYQPKNKK